MPTPVIVTGAAGFIGSHLTASLLADGHRVVGIDNFDPFYDRAAKEANIARVATADFELVEADLLDRAAIERTVQDTQPAAVYHLAALAGVRPSTLEPARFASVNVTGLVNILDAARASGCRSFVFASSSSVYGNLATVPFSETDDVSAPISPYAATKRAGELLGHTYAHLFDLSIAAVRLFTVFGPAQRPDLAISRFMRLIADGDEIPRFGDGSSSRDYTYVDDIVRGLRAAAVRLGESDPGFFRIYNLGGAHPVTLTEMIETIGAVVGRTPRIRELPMQPGDVERTFADLTRSREELGFEPQVGFREGLERQWSWMQG